MANYRAVIHRRLFLIFLLFSLVSAPGHATTLFFSAIPLQDLESEERLYSLVADSLGEQLGMKVKFRASQDYQHTLTLFQDGDIYLAWFGGLTGLTGLMARKADPGDARVIWQSPYFSDYHFTVRSDIEARYGKGFTKKLQDALLALSANGRIMNIFRRSHFVTADNADFKVVAEAAGELGLLGDSPPDP